MEKRELICIGCPLGCPLTVTMEETGITVTGNTCKRGEIYAKKRSDGSDPRGDIFCPCK